MTRLPLSERQIAVALDRAALGLEKYQWIMRRVRDCDARRDAEFQRAFNGFYKVRRDEAWRRQYFALLEQAKATPMTFSDVLRAIHTSTGRVEASYSSKLVATLNPSLPVWDRYVLDFFGLCAPYPYQRDRVACCERLYGELYRLMVELVASAEGRLICAMFARRYPRVGVSDLKRVDLVLWQHRA